MIRVSKRHGQKEVLKDISLSYFYSAKIGVLGLNGAGKSTLLKILAGVDTAFEGKTVLAPGYTIGYLEQEPLAHEERTVREVVEDGVAGLKAIVREYEEINEKFSEPMDDEAMNALIERQSKVQEEMDAQNLWDLDSRIDMAMDALRCPPPDMPVSQVSGGERRRVALCRLLLQSPDILLLDEPTNHLDAESVQWLEDYLHTFPGTVIAVTHDRYFLDNVAGWILELDKGKIYSYDANYSGYLELKMQREEMAQASEKKRLNILRNELAWVQRGARARSTKQKARLQRFEELKNVKGPVTDGKVELTSAASRLGRTTVEIENVSKSYGDKVLIRDFTYLFGKDDRVGFIGPNGSGKTTLMKMILGEVAPDSGHIEIGQTVKLGYYAQEIDDTMMHPEQRVIDYIRDVAEYITTEDGQITAARMLERFLFSGEDQYGQLGKLSGGERRRLQLCKVLRGAPNVLILDEPTNDLDIATLQVLEDYLDTFPGIVIVVSHDRYFLDRVVRRIFALEDTRMVQYEGGYTDYANRKAAEGNTESTGTAAASQPKNADEETTSKNWKNGQKRKLKFTYQEQKDYESIEGEMAALEDKIATLEADFSKYASDFVKLNELTQEKEAAEQQLEEKMERWMYLEDLAARIERGEEN